MTSRELHLGRLFPTSLTAFGFQRYQTGVHSWLSWLDGRICEPQAARACIVANYQIPFDELDPSPSAVLLAEAKASPNPYYLEHLEKKLGAVGSENGRQQLANISDLNAWRKYTKVEAFESSTHMLRKTIGLEDINTGFDWMYDGAFADISSIELSVSAIVPDSIGSDSEVQTDFDRSINEELNMTGRADLEILYVEEVERVFKQQDVGDDVHPTL